MIFPLCSNNFPCSLKRNALKTWQIVLTFLLLLLCLSSVRPGLSGLLEAQYQQASLTLEDLHLKTQQSPAMISSLSFFKRIKTKLKVSHTNRTLFSTCSGFLKDKRSSYLYVESGVKIWSLLKQDMLESWPSP